MWIWIQMWVIYLFIYFVHIQVLCNSISILWANLNFVPYPTCITLYYAWLHAPHYVYDLFSYKPFTMSLSLWGVNRGVWEALLPWFFPCIPIRLLSRIIAIQARNLKSHRIVNFAANTTKHANKISLNWITKSTANCAFPMLKPRCVQNWNVN